MRKVLAGCIFGLALGGMGVALMLAPQLKNSLVRVILIWTIVCTVAIVIAGSFLS